MSTPNIADEEVTEVRMAGRRKVTLWEMYRMLKNKLRSSAWIALANDLVQNCRNRGLYCGPLNTLSQGADN